MEIFIKVDTNTIAKNPYKKLSKLTQIRSPIREAVKNYLAVYISLYALYLYSFVDCTDVRPCWAEGSSHPRAPKIPLVTSVFCIFNVILILILNVKISKQKCSPISRNSRKCANIPDRQQWPSQLLALQSQLKCCTPVTKEGTNKLSGPDRQA